MNELGQNQTLQTVENDEITLKELILKIRLYAKEVLRRWYIPFLLAALFAGGMFYLALKSKPQYLAKLSFMLNEGDKGGGALAALAGSFGFGGGGGGESNLDKITYLAKSERILKTTLLTKTVVDGKEDYFANHFINVLELHKAWKKDTTGLQGFLFKRDDVEAFTRLENNALTRLVKVLIGKKGIYGCSFDKKSGILEMNLKTPNESLSINFIRQNFAGLSEFYINKITERERTNYEAIRAQKDSIYQVMKNKGSSAASFQDFNKGLLFQGDRFKGDMMAVDAKIAGTAYGEIMKSYAIADYSLRNNTPFISPIDQPVGPIEPEKKSKLTQLIIGVFLGAFLGTLYVVFAMILREAMK